MARAWGPSLVVVGDMKTLAGARRIATVALIVLAMALLPPAAPTDAGGRGGRHGQAGGHKPGGGHKHSGDHGKHFRHGSRGAFFVGAAPWGWGPPYWYDPWPYWSAPPRTVQAPPVYIEQSPAPTHWHYCEDPPGYYPSVQQCPTEWLRVLPQPGR
jgi:hypothetical protein